MSHLLSIEDLAPGDLRRIVHLALALKHDPRLHDDALTRRTLLMVSSKPSLRTRLSFEVAMTQLGGNAIAYALGESTVATKETFRDLGATASRYVDVIVARLHAQSDLEDVAAGSRVPVVNGLTDHEHPCQALGDMALLEERIGLDRARLAYVGDGCNNVTHSLLLAAAELGLDMRIACPPGMAPEAGVMAGAQVLAQRTGASLRVTHDPREAVRNANALYTDTWMSYHVPEAQREARVEALAPYRLDAGLLAEAAPDAMVMHCLPATRGEEITADVLDGPHSVVFDQAEMRLHAQKALLLALLRPGLVRAISGEAVLGLVA